MPLLPLGPAVVRGVAPPGVVVLLAFLLFVFGVLGCEVVAGVGGCVRGLPGRDTDFGVGAWLFATDSHRVSVGYATKTESRKRAREALTLKKGRKGGVTAEQRKVRGLSMWEIHVACLS